MLQDSYTMPPSSLPALDLGAPVLLSALHLWDEVCRTMGYTLLVAILSLWENS